LVLGVVVAATFVAAILVRTSSMGASEVLGHPVLKVLSGSMTPTFRTGDLVVDRPLPRAATESLHVGEIVTFREPGSGGSVLVTHRIFRVVRQAGPGGGPAQVAYETKGDANNSPDLWRVTPSEVVGRYEWRIPDGGYVLNVLESRWMLGAGLLLLVAWVLGGVAWRDRDAREPAGAARGRDRRAASRARHGRDGEGLPLGS
jgi:signal peptidase